MLLDSIVLLVALAISSVAAYYSIIGLTTIFAATFWPVVVMGSVLELGKIVSTIWLRKNWNEANRWLKSYILAAIFGLMLLTSMGVFGLLSKGHIDQGIGTGDKGDQIVLIEEKIKTEQELIASNRAALKQMDATVNETIGRTKEQNGAERALQIRRSQAKERAKIATDIDKSQKTIAQLQEKKAPLSSEVRKMEAEVGPIKYIAALLYGDNPSQTVLEQAVRWVIILIVVVFDPLALALVIAANSSMEKRRKEKDAVSAPPPQLPAPELVVENPVVPEVIEKLNAKKRPTKKKSKIIEPVKTEKKSSPVITTYNDFESPGVFPVDEPPIEPKINISVDVQPVPEQEPLALLPNEQLDKLKNWLLLNNNFGRSSHSGFGIAFPIHASKGDTFLRVDVIPSKLFKYTGSDWIEVNKEQNGSYINDAYLRFLIEQLSKGVLNIDALTENEQEDIRTLLEQEKL
jgi:hypothetical protein